MLKGAEHTKESKQKMKEAKIKFHPLRGKHHNELTKIKISNSHKLKKYDFNGKNNPNYGKIKNPNRSILHIIRGLFEYREWKNKILKRDNYTCKKCGIKNNLIVHHIKSLKRIVDENDIKTSEQALKCGIIWNVSNGITFCKYCHYESVY